MLTEHRKRILLGRLKAEGRLIAKELSLEFGLSEDTLRRDLRELAADGLLQRVHGGALPASPTIANLQTRRTMATAEKSRLGRAGAKLIEPGRTTFIDGGTTNLELVRALPLDAKATIVTHSPTIADTLEHHTGIDVRMIGGKLYRHSMVAVGAAAVAAIQTQRYDLFILGLTGLHPEEGLTTGDFEEAEIKRAIMARSAETVSLVTSEKLGATSVHTIASTAALTTAIVTQSASVAKFRKSGISFQRV